MKNTDAPVLVIVCPKHSDQTGVIEKATLVPSENDGVRMHFDTAAPRELIQGIPHEGAPARVLDLASDERGVSGVDAGVEAGKGRWRLLLECPRPSCNYRVERLLHPYREHLRTLLDAMRASGESTWVFTDVNREPWQWRRVTTIDGQTW